jgi:hypothetical protein
MIIRTPLPRAVIVHSLADARAALAVRAPVTLLSAPGAALYAGCLWWRELVAAAGLEHPGAPVTDVLDCADGSGQALAASRMDVTRLVLWREAPGWDQVAAIVTARGGFLLDTAPPALDLGQRGAIRRLSAWLHGTLPAGQDPA